MQRPTAEPLKRAVKEVPWEVIHGRNVLFYTALAPFRNLRCLWYSHFLTCQRPHRPAT